MILSRLLPRTFRTESKATRSRKFALPIQSETKRIKSSPEAIGGTTRHWRGCIRIGMQCFKKDRRFAQSVKKFLGWSERRFRPENQPNYLQAGILCRKHRLVRL